MGGGRKEARERGGSKRGRVDEGGGRKETRERRGTRKEGEGGDEEQAPVNTLIEIA